MKAIVNNSCCQIFDREKLTRGTVGKTMEAKFPADWDGLAITAVFEAGDIKKDAVYTGDPIVIPHEVLATAGVSVMLGFHGALPDGTIVKRTEKEWVNNVSETLDPAGVPSSEPTPDWTAQVQNIATRAKEVADSVRSDADAGKFKGDRGDAGATGPAGPRGPKGDTGAAGTPGEDGGYYTPAITQPDANTLRVAFTPSKEDMPAVEPADITIPTGGGSGTSGEDGGYYSPSVDADGNLSWTASKAGMPAVDGANIKGPKGDTGATGPKGDTGATGATGQAGADGKSAYAYAVEGGYTGTEAEFAAKLAQEKYANPEALTFTGAATGSYDGSQPLTVNIPSGEGTEIEKPEIVYTLEEDVSLFTVPVTDFDPAVYPAIQIAFTIPADCTGIEIGQTRSGNNCAKTGIKVTAGGNYHAILIGMDNLNRQIPFCIGLAGGNANMTWYEVYWWGYNNGFTEGYYLKVNEATPFPAGATIRVRSM